METNHEITLEEILEAREQRASFQQKLLKEYQQTLISFTLNIPGKLKMFPLAEKTFRLGNQLIGNQLDRNHITVLFQSENLITTGYEAFYVVDASATKVKKLMIVIEEYHPLGRLLDIDVFSANGELLKAKEFGRTERTCFLCGNPVWQCARQRTHTGEELFSAVEKRMKDFFQQELADLVSGLAQKALLYELHTTPKPGLVDCHNAGAHTDMGYATFLNSISTLQPYFRDCTLNGQTFTGEPKNLLRTLRFRGMEADTEMLLETGGINTHKGAIFSLGVLCATVGYLAQQEEVFSVSKLLATAGIVAASALEDFAEQPNSHGEHLYANAKITGARGEVATGFPSVATYGFPVLHQKLAEGCSPNDAGVIALLHLLAYVEDTNILHRGGRGTLEQIQIKLQQFLQTDFTVNEAVSYAKTLDEEFIQQNISPGGCADLLGVSFFLEFLIQNDSCTE